MRLWLAIRAFFAILFGKPLAPEIAIALSIEPPALPAGPIVEPAKAAPEPAKPPEVKPEAPKPGPPSPEPARVEPKPEPPKVEPKPEPPKVDMSPVRLEAAAVQVLAVLQSEGRLIDFLSEDIEGYGDADIGAAVRDVHRGLKRALKDHFPVEPIRKEDEDAHVTVPEGFDPAQVRLVGNVIGKPPFAGTLKHKGWKVTAVNLPRIPDGDAARVIAPAEVEI